ncbi:MAG: hypothetical protein OER86_06855 [Phycisphaerae bacterium]|nr:hypothetical protein [Phycisphaerae bacterium]
MSIALKHTELFVLNMRTRFPFKYGIASLEAVPHLLIRVDAELDGRPARGLAAEGLPPKWFTKDPQTSFRDDLADMLHVIESAFGFAEQVGAADCLFDLWQQVYAQQMQWATGQGYPPLLWSFGVSLVERALISALTTARQIPVAQAIRENLLGVRLGEIHQELSDHEPANLLPPRPLSSLRVRHTVGLADPLLDVDIPQAERCQDGLPQSLEASIAAYGLDRFKIKLSGQADQDVDRLGRIARLLDAHEGNYAFSLDGNEQYRDVAGFRELWSTIESSPELGNFLTHLLFVEQPLHRDVALSPEALDEIQAWDGRPPMIIDESDGSLGSSTEVIEGGYVGTSHKNCKGVIKGVANAALVEHRCRQDPGGRYILSGEDLANVGPVALLQDLAIMATLGVKHVERNGHHYFRGLSMYPRSVQQQVIAAHPDLYREHELGFATLAIHAGRIDLGSVVAAPFGLGLELDVTEFTPLDAWTYESLVG